MPILSQLLAGAAGVPHHALCSEMLLEEICRDIAVTLLSAGEKSETSRGAGRPVC